MAKNKIRIKPSKRGSLRKHLGVSKGKKIPASKLKIKSGDSPAIRKKKQFAINARKWKHPLGGLIMSGIGLVGDLIGNLNEKKLQEQQDEMLRQQSARNYALEGQAGVSNNYLPTFAYGGGINAEIEREEIVVPPNGIQAGVRRKFNLPTHKNKTGSNLISAEPGSFVLSDRLMYDDKMTMAQAYEEAGKKADKNQKVLDSPKSTPLAIKTAKRNLDNIKKLQQQIVEKNQLMLAEKQGTIGANGIPMAQDGLEIPGKKDNTGILTGAMSLAPVLANLFGGLGKAEKLNPNEFYNPMAQSGLADMANRRYDTGPAYAANVNAARAAMGDVASQAGGSRGMINANRQALLSARMMADAAVGAQAQNVNNQYLGEQAQYKAGIGQQMAATKLGISDINARNIAAKRGLLRTAAGQFGQFGQTQQLMRNQKQRDAEMMKRWQELFDMMSKSSKTGQSGMGTTVASMLGAYMPDPSYANQMAGRQFADEDYLYGGR